MKVEVSAPGKVFISGEYLVLDGSPATILSTKQRAKITIEDSNNTFNVLYSLPLNKSFAFNVNNDFKIDWINDDPEEMGLFIEQAILEMQIKPTKVQFVIDTTNFYFQNKKIGIGSSAAISSALTNAINKYFDKGYSQKKIIDTAISLHKRAQGTLGSGLDVIAAFADSGLIECDLKTASQKSWTVLEWPSDLIIKGVITNKQSRTKQMIEKYFQSRNHNKEFFMELQLKAEVLFKNLSSAWRYKDTRSILELMEEHNLLMQELNKKYHLGIYTDEHKDLENLASQSGLFYKPSGAGGGDLGFILSDSEIKVKKLLMKIKKKNLEVIDLRG